MLTALIIFALLFSTSAIAGHEEGDTKQPNKYYTKIIDNSDRQETRFTCDTFEVTTYNFVMQETQVEIVSHPILAAVAYCPSLETTTHSVTRIYSSVSDMISDKDKTPIYWYATASCVEDHYEDPYEFPAAKVILHCWDNENDTEFPGIAKEGF